MNESLIRNALEPLTSALRVISDCLIACGIVAGIAALFAFLAWNEARGARSEFRSWGDWFRRQRPFASILAIITLALAGAGCSEIGSGAQETQPDRYGEQITSQPVLPSAGLRANAPIPNEMDQENIPHPGDRKGLCVYASSTTALRFLGKPDAAERLWRGAQADPRGGGSYPEKFESLAQQVIPDVKFSQYQGRDYNVLINLSRQKIPVPVTMGTGSLYGYGTVAHMVCGVHFDEKRAAIKDNNDPGKTYWMPAQEFMRRWMMPNGTGWAIGFQPAGMALGISGIAAAIVIIFALSDLASPKTHAITPRPARTPHAAAVR